MKYWAMKILNPYINDFEYETICEIGASTGAATDKLRDSHGVHISIIDPCLDAELEEKYKSSKNVNVYKGLSLDILSKVNKKFDCFLIDGDHNWYTVYNELRIIHERQLLADGGTIFFHDVGWPYARRDMYYQPDLIPDEHVHPFAKMGIIYGQSELSPTSGENREFYNAEYEGGMKNGVLTAIEDFIQEKGRDYFLFCFKDEVGLGVLVKRNGNYSKSRLVKWFIFSKFHNAYAFLKTFIKRKLPSLYGILKGNANNANQY